MSDFDFGDDLDEMVQFCLERGEALLITGCSEARADHRVWMQFCLQDPKNAEDYAERFGGEVLEL
jgi:hypothetical protein